MQKKQEQGVIGDGTRAEGVQSFFLKKGTPRPPRIIRAKGIHMWDHMGNKYIDASSGPVAVNIGHGNRNVIKAMNEQAKKVSFAFPLLFESEANITFAEELTKLTGPEYNRAMIMSSGSEAIETCMKFARIHAVRSGESDRHIFISRNPSFHGATLGAQALIGDDSMRAPYKPIMISTPQISTPMMYRTPHNMTAEQYSDSCAQELEDEIIKQGPEKVLAFFLEPICGLSGGAAYAPDSYYKKIRQICTKYGLLLVCDEVLTGSGRTGKYLASHHWPELCPDIIALSKGLGSGYYPISAMLTSQKMAEVVADTGGFPHAQTFTGSPLACATGSAVIREIIGNKLVENSDRMGKLLRKELRKLQETCPVIGDVRGKGLLIGLEIVADQTTKKMLPNEINSPAAIGAIGMKHGLVLYPRRTGGGKFGEWLMITPPLIITEEEVIDLVERIKVTLTEFTNNLTRQGVI